MHTAHLIGTGATRSLYELTAHDRKARAFLFDMQVEASAAALEARALKAGTTPTRRLLRSLWIMPGGSSRRKHTSKANASGFRSKLRPNHFIECREAIRAMTISS